MQVDQKDIIPKEYILLDWNVIKYLKNPRSDSDRDFLVKVCELYKRFEFPFCEAHLRDLARSYSESNKQLVKDDLSFLKRLSRDVAIGIEDKSEALFLVKSSSDELFKEIVNETPPVSNITAEMNPQSTFKVDMKALGDAHPMKEHLEKTNGIWNPEIMADFLNSLFNPMFDETGDYKKFRAELARLKSNLNSNNQNTSLCQCDIRYKEFLAEHMMPFLEALEIENENDLCVIWKSVITKFLQLHGYANIPFVLLISSAYDMLDLHPLFKEKISKKNTLSNIVRDSKMIYFASSGKFFVTEDKNCYKKSLFIFKAFELNVQVLNMEKVLQKFG